MTCASGLSAWRKKSAPHSPGNEGKHIEASTPRTFQHYTKHIAGASFGTKFEGLAVSRAIPQQVAGLYHAGSVGIIMSGWLGAINYGVIVANDVDAMLMKAATPAPSAAG